MTPPIQAVTNAVLGLVNWGIKIMFGYMASVVGVLARKTRETGVATAAVLAVAGVPGTATAAEIIYNFSGKIVNQHQFSAANPQWQFAENKLFSGQLKIDTSLITSQQTVINDPNYQFIRYFGPIVSLSYTIDTQTGTYSYSPPSMGQSSLAVGAGTQSFGFNGVDLRWQNYPISGVPQTAVPAGAMVGSYTPHASFVTLGSFMKLGLLDGTHPDVDLQALFGQLDPFPTDTATLTVRFSDPALWPPGQERIDAIVTGEITSFARSVSGVPEPGSWMLMIAGFGLIGTSLRRQKRRTRACAA